MEVFNNLIILAILLFIVIYVVLPLLFTFKPVFMQHLFFMTFVTNPFVDFSNLPANDIKSHGRSFFLKNGKIIERCTFENDDDNLPLIGVWHILPASLSALLTEEEKTETKLEQLMRTGEESIILYLHGNTLDRAAKYRCEVYNILSNLNFHIITFDYRGYGDSTGVPSEEGFKKDAHTVYNYIKSVAPQKKIFIWGHSMGTAVAINFVAKNNELNNFLQGLILESPFNNLHDVIFNHTYNMFFRFLPFFNEIFIVPLMRSGLVMESDKRIRRVDCPILVLHAVDDNTIPVKLARELVQAAKQGNCNVKYVEFGAERSFGHLFILRAKELPELLRDFLIKCDRHKSLINLSCSS